MIWPSNAAEASSVVTMVTEYRSEGKTLLIRELSSLLQWLMLRDGPKSQFLFDLYHLSEDTTLIISTRQTKLQWDLTINHFEFVIISLCDDILPLSLLIFACTYS